ncbi:unnamed protein product [Schistosoma turkestanicum]|nr:unnamed protein product [Schistosoma turkestanicum]
MSSNTNFSNYPETHISKVKRDILQRINKSVSISRATKINDLNLKYWLSKSFIIASTHESQNIVCDCNHLSSHTDDNIGSYISPIQYSNCLYPVSYMGSLSWTSNCEECKVNGVSFCQIQGSDKSLDDCFTSVIRSRMRIYFGCWLLLATDYQSARILRNYNLLKSVLLFWKCEFGFRTSLKLSYRKAADIHNLNLKSRSLFIWVSYTQRKLEKNKLKRMANAKYRYQKLRNHMTCWKTKHFLTEGSVVEKSMLSAARAHDRRHTLRKALCIWISRNQFWQQKRSLLKTALKFLENNLHKGIMVSVIREWCHQVLDIQMSSKHNRYRILKTFLKIWSHRTEVTIMERQMYDSACTMYSISMRRFYFLLWRNYANHRQKIYKQTKMGIRFYKINQMKKYLNAWMNYRLLAVDRRNNVQSMVMKYNTSLIRQCLLKWKDYCTLKQSFLSKISQFKMYQKNALLKEYFQYWLNNLHCKQSQELIIYDFRQQMQMQFIKKLFLAWLQWAFSHRQYRLKIQRTFELSLENIRIVTIRIWWTRWRSMHNYCLNIQLAYRLYKKHILVQCFNSWSTFITNEKYNKKLMNMANDFRMQTIQKQFFNQWHTKLIEYHKFQTLQSIALIRWSLCLQLKVWKAWHLWIEKQKSKKNQRKLALQRYYEHKTMDALRVWIIVALNRRHERHRNYCEKFWNNNIRVFNLVLNIATHWYWCTFSRKRNQHFNEPTTNSVWIDMSKLTNENHISTLKDNGSSLKIIRNKELTPARYPDFIFSELNSLGLTNNNTVQFEQSSIHVSSSCIETSHHETTTNCPVTHCSSYSFPNIPDIHKINFYLNSLMERISYYRMIKYKYKLMHQRLCLNGQLKNRLTCNQEVSKF